MKAMIAWWDLTTSQQNGETLRDFIREEEKHWADIPGLLLKVWVSDPATERWGAVLLWESEEAARNAVLPRSPAELIGHPLDFRSWFDVEAAVGSGVTLPWRASQASGPEEDRSSSSGSGTSGT